jgi:hypothetical protein
VNWITPEIHDFYEKWELDAASLQRSFIVLPMFENMLIGNIRGIVP